MPRFFLKLAIGLLPFAVVYAAPDIHPVPGSGAAYLYFPGEVVGRVKLKIIKEFANVVQDRYEVYFQPRKGRQELICSVDEESCEQLVASGQGELTIKGFYDPARKLPISMAKFTGGCSTTGAKCKLNLKAGNTETVRITTGCNATEYSVVNLSDGNERNRHSVLCVGPSLDGSSYLLAAHRSIRGNLRAKTDEQQSGFTSTRDGKGNTRIMMDTWDKSKFSERESAAHTCDQLSVGAGNNRYTGWYVPAEQELSLVLSGWDAAKQSFIIPKDSAGYWTSTEKANRRSYYANVYRWSNNSKNLTYNGINSPASVICVYSIPM